MKAGPEDEPFALRDDRDATRARPTSRLYRGFVREHACVDPAALDGAWDEVERELRAGGHALLLADYEWGAKLLHAGDEAFAADDRAALRVLVFRDLARLSKDEADAGLAQREGRETRRCSR